MTFGDTVNKVCALKGEAPPNTDAETGIRYGVIPGQRIAGEALDDIFQNGDDLDYADAVDEVKAAIRSVLSEPFTVTTEEGKDKLLADLSSALDDHFNNGDNAAGWIVDALSEEDGLSCFLYSDDEAALLSRLVDTAWEAVSDSFDFEGSGDCRRISYEVDNLHVLQASDGDLFITRSEFVTVCSECSPCAPCAGYLTDQSMFDTYDTYRTLDDLKMAAALRGCVVAYALDADWYSDYAPLKQTLWRLDRATGKVTLAYEPRLSRAEKLRLKWLRFCARMQRRQTEKALKNSGAGILRYSLTGKLLWKLWRYDHNALSLLEMKEAAFNSEVE